MNCQLMEEKNVEMNMNLPTYGDVENQIILQQNEFIKNGEKFNLNKLGTISFVRVGNWLKEMWNKADIPTVTMQQIILKLKNFQKKRRSLLKSNKNIRRKSGFKKKAEHFLAENNKLFNIAACKCVDECHCPIKSKVCL